MAFPLKPWVRHLAVALLLFAGLDLAAPSTCLPPSTPPACTDCVVTQPGTDAPDLCDDDCFCCSRTVVTQDVFQIVALTAGAGTRGDRMAGLPVPIGGAMFHPPQDTVPSPL